ncbi:Fpg/Nei family DNA glycosylase [Pseudonocardia pini]|uniref:Fpg/Nei family DNA glycosylase n=1 Tax=Pseudonocardia pini TaxID=2758030 RepID=UPI0015EFE913|nr:DNA-formamidopyrimidine glycosylase family protein [Pseudonocardia pini]
MPELPEVETARKVLEGALDRVIESIDDNDEWVCRPHPPGQIARTLVGGKLTAAHRRGKTMWCETDTGHTLGVHLGMGGRVIVTNDRGERIGGGPERPDRQPRKPEWDRFTMTFVDGGRFRLFDKRRLGRIRLDPSLDGVGPDAEHISPADFRTRIARSRSAVKARLLDQSVLAGVGNLLADETLWRAKVNPAAPADELERKDLDRLYRNLERSLRSAIANGGVHTGEVIEHRHPGGHCPRCGAEMRHGTVGGRSTWWCSKEQA